MAKMLNYRFRYNVTALFRATFLLWICDFPHTHEKGRPTVSSCHMIPLSLASSEVLTRCCASSLREAHSWAGSPWTQQNVFFTSECSCEQQAVMYLIQFVGVSLNFILLGVWFFFSFLHVNISVNLCWLLGCSIPGRKKKKKNLLWPTKHGNGSFNEQLEVVPPKPFLQGFFGHPAEHRKCHSHTVHEEHSWNTGWTTL